VYTTDCLWVQLESKYIRAKNEAEFSRAYEIVDRGEEFPTK